MNFKVLCIVMHVIFLAALAATLGSVAGFVFLPKTTGTVTSIDAYPEDTLAHLSYTVDHVKYEKVLKYSGSKQIKVGDVRTVWYFPKKPDKTIAVRDFAPYYILTGIFGIGEIAFFAGRKQREDKE